MSPVVNIFMDRSVLHVLTTTSLETYTIRLFPSSSPSPVYMIVINIYLFIVKGIELFSNYSFI